MQLQIDRVVVRKFVTASLKPVCIITTLYHWQMKLTNSIYTVSFFPCSMLDRKFIIFGLLFLFIGIHHSENVDSDDISLNYEFDYSSNVEVKNSSDNFTSLVGYLGKIETSLYMLTDKQELLLLKFNVHGAGKVSQEKQSVTSIVIRKQGMVQKIIVDDLITVGMLNLLKGVVNLLNIDEMRENKTESDVSGECSVTYVSLREDLLLKEKSQCNKTIYFSPNDIYSDSFSLYKESKVNVFYKYNQERALVSIKSVETHILEPVLFQDLSQEYKSVTTITFKKVTKSRSLINSVSLDSLIRLIFGKSYREVFQISTWEILHFENTKRSSILKQIKSLLESQTENNRSSVTLKLIILLRQISNKSEKKRLIIGKFSKIHKEILHDATISCGTEFCSKIVLEELDQCIRNDESEAIRILLLIQNIRLPNEFLVKKLWNKLNKLKGNLYNQALQTLSSLINTRRGSEYLESDIADIITFIKNKISLCTDDQCFQVHLSAIKNTRMADFSQILLHIIRFDGNYSEKVVADALNSLWILKYDETSVSVLVEDVYQLVKDKINFLDPYSQYQAIYCLIMLQVDNVKLISVLDDLKINNSNYQYFLVKKIKELSKMGIITNNSLFNSNFFKNFQSLTFTNSGKGSDMLVKKLFSTDNSYMDIHFNTITSEGGIIKHSISDLFLLSTAMENSVFSLSLHMDGLQSIGFSNSEESTEDVKGLLQLSLLGKRATPVILFHGSTNLMSTIWNAPTDLKPILQGTFVPIDLQTEIIFQNGIILNTNYMGTLYVDFSFQLTTSLWYKTAESLLRTSGNVYVKMESNLKSLSQTASLVKELTIDTGIDFETKLNFGSTPIKNCMSFASLNSEMKIKSNLFVRGNKRAQDPIRLKMSIPGVSYSLTPNMDKVCGTF